MYSMKRRTWPVLRKWRAISRMWSSLTPRCTTMSTFTGVRPAVAAFSIASSTFATGKPTSFIDWNVVSSSESRLTVTRRRPAAFRARALSGVSSAPLVVIAMSSSPSIPASISTSFSKSRRSIGSPPVRRTFLTPRLTKTRVRRAISSKLSSSSRDRKT